MPKPKAIKPEGQVLQVPEEKVPEVIEVSYTQAKKLNKKPMSEKQALAAAKLVELNRIRWEQKKKEKEDQERKKQEEIEATTQKIVVKPKRVYPKKPKPMIPVAESSAEETSEEEPSSEESSEDIHEAKLQRQRGNISLEEVKQYQKKKVKKEKKVKAIDEKIQKLEEINHTLRNISNNPNPYTNMLGKFFNR